MSFKSLRRWWQIRTGKLDTPIDGEVPFWGVSLVFHLVLLVLLARMIMPTDRDKSVQLDMEPPPPEVEVDELPEVDFDEMVQEEIGAKAESGFEMVASMAPTIDVSVDPVDVEMETYAFGEIFSSEDFTEATGATFSERAVKGSVGNSVSGASGAVDRITQEILLSMQERKTLVVWLFDQSASLMRQREEIQSRFNKIYEELGVLENKGHAAFKNKSDQPLLTQIAAFGSQYSLMLPEPSEDLAIVTDAISRIQRDDTGIENVMTAVIMSVNKYSKLRKIDRATGQPERNVLLIVVSDEAGDDVQRVDEAVQVCTKFQMPVYVIGVPAPFGRAETLVKWVDPDPKYDQQPQWAAVSQGPESVLPERLRLDFAGDFADLDMIDSGFGPFHLTRLAFETGGIYFAVHPNRNTERRVMQYETSPYAANLQYFFDPQIMRRYKPDYVTQQTYLARLQANACRRSLVQSAAFTTTGTLESVRTRFPRTDDARFVQDVTLAQRAAAIVEPQLNRLYDMIRAGEEDRKKELSKRWQAGYDLALGRTIAAKVRAQSYNAMLALAKTKLKFDPPKNANTPQNNTWVLKQADTIDTGSQDQKLLEKARELLTRVVEEHPGTPWAMLAQRELDTPLGWKWEQSYTAPPAPRMANNNNNNNNNNPNPQPRENQMPKPVRPVPKL